MDNKANEETDDLRNNVVDIVVTLGFHINTMGALYADPRYYSEKEIFGMLITQSSDIVNYLMNKFGITEDEYKERISKCVRENKIITIERDTGYENIEFG